MLSSCKYCVVIPHRNVLELLEKCLASIPPLPYIYVLVVDNSDEDKKAKQAIESFSYGFGGLTVIDREPRGIGYIRNEALRYLRERGFTGKLVFADADDYFTPEAKDCFERFKDTDYDLVWFAVRGVNEKGEPDTNAEFVNQAIAIYDQRGDWGGLRYNCGPVWGKLIDMELIRHNEIWFQEIDTCEDTLFSAQLGYYSQKPFVSHIPFYVYAQRLGSLVMVPDKRKARIGFEAAYDTTCWLKDRTKEGYDWTQYDVVWHWINWCKMELRAWRAFPKVLGLCDTRSALKGAGKVIKSRFK